MGQKVSPIGLRLGINKDWEAKWYANNSEFSDYLQKDLKIRKYIEKNLDEDDYKFIGGSGSIIVRPGMREEIRELASEVLDSFRD